MAALVAGGLVRFVRQDKIFFLLLRVVVLLCSAVRFFFDMKPALFSLVCAVLLAGTVLWVEPVQTYTLNVKKPVKKAELEIIYGNTPDKRSTWGEITISQ